MTPAAAFPLVKLRAAYRNRTDDLFITRVDPYRPDLRLTAWRPALTVHARPMASGCVHGDCHSLRHSSRQDAVKLAARAAKGVAPPSAAR